MKEETKKAKLMKILTSENAKSATMVRSIKNPGWGVKAFHYNSEKLINTFESSVGVGCNTVVLFESEFKFWEIIK